MTSDPCTDLAGNTATGVTSADFQIDKTAPVITGVASPAANANGWNKTSVSVTFTCADVGSVQSGIDLDTVADDDQNLTAQTNGTTVTSNGDCIDKAGNFDNSESVGPIKIDLTDPLVAITSPATGYVTVASSVTVSGTASDSNSGVEKVNVNGGPKRPTPRRPGLRRRTSHLRHEHDLRGRDGSRRSGDTASIAVIRVCAATLQYYQPIDQTVGSATPSRKQRQNGPGHPGQGHRHLVARWDTSRHD